MKLVTRSEWGARKPDSINKFNGPLKGLTVHWGGPSLGIKDHSQCAGKVRAWQDFHMDTRGWADIAYNFVACPHGYVFVGRGASAANAANGYSAVNETYMAVCYLGGEGDAFTAEAKEAILELATELKAPVLNAHRDHKSTECPGGIIYAWVCQHTRPPTGSTIYPSDPKTTQPIAVEAEMYQLVETVDTKRLYAVSGSKVTHMNWEEFLGFVALQLFINPKDANGNYVPEKASQIEVDRVVTALKRSVV